MDTPILAIESQAIESPLTYLAAADLAREAHRCTNAYSCSTCQRIIHLILAIDVASREQALRIHVARRRNLQEARSPHAMALRYELLTIWRTMADDDTRGRGILNICGCLSDLIASGDDLSVLGAALLCRMLVQP